MKRTMDTGKSCGNTVPDLDHHSTQKSGWWQGKRDRDDEAPAETREAESDSSELSESSSDPSSDSESASDDDDDDSDMIEASSTPEEEYDWHAWQMHEEAEVQEYGNFPKLLNERKFCFLGAKERANTRFLDLEKFPAEIRNQIYKYIIPHDGVIELWADRHNEQGPWWFQTFPNKTFRFARYEKEITPCLKLLRVNKQIGKETASLFYSTNEFRFSGLNGWSVLLSFMITIGLWNSTFLTKIAVHVPFRGGYPKTERNNQCTKTKTQLFDALKNSFGLRDPMNFLYEIREYLKNFAGTPDDCVKCVLRAFKTYGTLRSLTLVLPVEFRACRKYAARSPHLRAGTIIHKQRIRKYLHDLQQLHKAIPGIETPVIVRTDSREVNRVGRFSDKSLADRFILEELREYGTVFAPVYVDSLEWDLGGRK